MVVFVSNCGCGQNETVVCNIPSSSPHLLAASCSLGAAWAAIDKTTDYLKERKQFGQKLAKFQVRYPAIFLASH